jgi:hypothetical protein
MLSDCFVSIVSKDCGPDELMVRARRPGDIEKLFPGVVVTEYTASDYHYRAAVKKTAIKAALANEVDRVTYDNFKSSVDDDPLHNAYTRVWTAMASLQPQAPYSGMFAPVKVKPAFRNRQNDKKPPAKKRKRPEQMR